MLRTYAFTGGKKSVLALLAACLAGVVGYQAWVGATQSASAYAGSIAFRILIMTSTVIQAGNGCFPVDVGPAKHLSVRAPMTHARRDS